MSKEKSENYLERVPVYPELEWSIDGDSVTIAVENKGVFNRIAQKLLKKPKTSYVHLDEFGSFVWQQVDGERDIVAIGTLVAERFGEKAEPLYERLAQFFKTLDSYSFIAWK